MILTWTERKYFVFTLPVKCRTVSFTQTPPEDVSAKITSIVDSCLLNTYNAKGFSLKNLSNFRLVWTNRCE